MSDRLCLFCIRPESDKRPWCLNPGKGCQYGFAHEYPEAEKVVAKEAPKKRDAKLCVKCGLHPSNPKSASSECVHEYEGG
jgi:hypothetical protein